MLLVLLLMRRISPSHLHPTMVGLLSPQIPKARAPLELHLCQGRRRQLLLLLLLLLLLMHILVLSMRRRAGRIESVELSEMIGQIVQWRPLVLQLALFALLLIGLCFRIQHTTRCGFGSAAGCWQQHSTMPSRRNLPQDISLPILLFSLPVLQILLVLGKQLIDRG